MTDQAMTREDVERFRALALRQYHMVKTTHDEWVGVYSALLMMIDNDAALREELTQARAELASIATTGVTENILRAHDGYIKIGKGCLVVREDEYLAMRAKLEVEP